MPFCLNVFLRASVYSLVLVSIFDRGYADDAELQQALQRAGENRSQLERAIEEAPAEQKAGIKFLVSNMPDSDLQSLTSEFLLSNSQLTWLAFNKAAWKDSVPEDVFLDCLLPYASVNERRDEWRKDFYERFTPLINNARTSGEAAALLNQQVFPSLKVKYSTGRKKADQSPFESMESGLASCTGLSILLVDACRAVGIPARIVGTPLWSDNSGNHTWVEVWDNGWHFTGACEPSGKELNAAWFIDRASKAQRDHRLHAIYAVTFRRNGQSFPMVWAREVHDVFAVNVTDRYTSLSQPVPEGQGTVRFRVTETGRGRRRSVPVRIAEESGTIVFEGKSKDDRFDANDHLTAHLRTGSTYQATAGESQEHVQFTVTEGEQLIELTLPAGLTE